MNFLEGVIAIGLVLIAARFLGIFKGAPFLPTDKATLQRMMDAALIKPGERVVDLGSGDGRILIAAAKAGAIAEGFEINPLLVWWSKYKIRQAGVSQNARVFWKSFWRADFSNYDIVMLFGITGIMNSLEQKLNRELKPGSRIISNTFRFPNWTYEKNMNVFVYKK